MKSLDPRVNRLPGFGSGSSEPKVLLDQLPTYEVFVQAKEGKPFQHEGIVHAADLELAYISAKETFTRRFTCVSLFVVATNHVHVSPLSDNLLNAYDLLPEYTPENDNSTVSQFEIFHLLKRGKQHVHVGSVSARSLSEAMHIAKQRFGSTSTVYNIWAVPHSQIRFTKEDEIMLWNTLPEKKYRDASDYKAGEKLTAFLERVKK